jgi:hypothetical protein
MEYSKMAIALAINHGVGYIYIYSPHSDPVVVGIVHYKGLIPSAFGF